MTLPISLQKPSNVFPLRYWILLQPYLRKEFSRLVVAINNEELVSLGTTNKCFAKIRGSKLNHKNTKVYWKTNISPSGGKREQNQKQNRQNVKYAVDNK